MSSRLSIQILQKTIPHLSVVNSVERFDIIKYLTATHTGVYRDSNN
jgi:hypothetical protein